MKTIFIKVSADERMPNKTDLYHTNRGMINYFHGLKKFEQDPHIDYWLEEIELPDGEAVANGCLEYLKQVGMVDGRHIIAHDWERGVNWLHEYITGKK